MYQSFPYYLPTTTPHNEPELLQRIAEGDEQAFTSLVDTYSPSLYTFILRITENQWLAEEVVQDSFVKIWLTRETLLTVQHFKAYLFVISKNFALKALQKVLKEDTQDIAWKAFYLQAQEDQPDQEPTLVLIDQAIAQLSPQQLKVWTLRRKQGLSYAAIAEELGISRETVKKHLQMAQQAIIRHVKAHILLIYMITVCIDHIT